MSDITQEIVSTPSESEKLKKEIKALQDEIAALAEERDYLKYHLCPELKAEYDSRIGVLELQLLCADGELRTLKLTLELMQAAKNRRQQVDYAAANEKARAEYTAYEEDLNRRAEGINNSAKYQEQRQQEESAWEEEKAERTRQKDNEEDSDLYEEQQENEENTSEKQVYRTRDEELKALYRKIIKHLHPDVNPNQTEEMKRMFQEAVDAYQNGDLEKLREIVRILDSEYEWENYKDNTEDIEKLREIRDTLIKIRDSLQKEISQIKSVFPYKYKDFLADDDAVAARQKELTDRIAWYNEQCRTVQERIDQMKEEENHYGEE